MLKLQESIRGRQFASHNFRHRRIKLKEKCELDEKYAMVTPSPPRDEIFPSRPRTNRKNQSSPKVIRVLDSARLLANALDEARVSSVKNDSALPMQPEARTSCQTLPPIRKIQSRNHLPPLATFKESPQNSSQAALNHSKDLYIKRPATSPLDAEIRALLRSCPKEPVFLYDAQKHRTSPSVAFRYCNSVKNSKRITKSN